jgi:hypothetical protein
MEQFIVGFVAGAMVAAAWFTRYELLMVIVALWYGDDTDEWNI